MTKSKRNEWYRHIEKYRGSGQIHAVKLSLEGRVLISAKVRAGLGRSAGMHLSLSVQDGAIRLFDRAQALRRAHDITRKYKKPGDSVVDQLLCQRRVEAGRE